MHNEASDLGNDSLRTVHKDMYVVLWVYTWSYLAITQVWHNAAFVPMQRQTYWMTAVAEKQSPLRNVQVLILRNAQWDVSLADLGMVVSEKWIPLGINYNYNYVMWLSVLYFLGLLYAYIYIL